MKAPREPIVVIVSADQEWWVVKERYSNRPVQPSPFGEWVELKQHGETLVFLHGGWGKIAAAASTQYAIQRWIPKLLVNLGTCGGFRGHISSDEVILAEETVIYDLIEQIGDPHVTLAAYTTRLDLSWLREPYPHPVHRTRMVSADRDLVPSDIPHLREYFGAIAADWESGAIAWVSNRNHVRCLILRGVSDLVSVSDGEAYGKIDVFESGARRVMERLLDALPAWLNCIQW